MRKKTLRVLSSLMCLFFLASLFQAPLLAAVETIPVRVGNQTLNVTPGQWVSVRSGTQITHYNVRFVDGRPVALEMSQYTKLVFGDAGVAGSAGSVADDVAQASNGNANSSSGSSSTKPTNTKPAGSSNQSSGSQTSNSQSTSAGSVADDVAQSGSTSKPSGTSNQSSGSTVSNSQSSTSQGNSVSAGTAADDIAAAGSVADDVAAGSTSKPAGTSNSQSTSAGSVADDVAQAGSTSKPAGTSNQSSGSTVSNSQGNAVSAGSVADDVAQSTSGSSSKTTTTTTTETSTTKSTWDSSRHPRDPQTGRFISHEEAVKRGLMDPPAAGSSADDVAAAGSTADDVAAAGSSADDIAAAGSTADDVAAAGSSADDIAAAGSTADDVAQAGAAGAGSVADDAAQTGTGKPSVGDKFRAGYETGKGMTNQGFQNVKDSLKSGFSAKNLLITAGITVGVDLATQIMRGEKPSMKKALKTVASAEFVGGVGGAVLGAAAGSFFVPFLSAVPVVGGVLSALAPSFGSIVGSSMGAYVAGDIKNGKFSIREAFKRIDWVGVTGQAIGSTAGAALGSALGPVSTIVGGMVGGYLGNWAAQKIAGFFRKDGPANMPEIAMPTGAGVPVGGVITIGNDESTPAPVASQNDTVTISGEVVGDYESEVALAYSKYQELYKLYNEMLRQGRQDDALKVADAMNAAKKEYDTLRTSK